MVDFEIEGGGEQVREAGEVVGAETAADAERREGGIGEGELEGIVAVELGDHFRQGCGGKLEEARLPREGARDLGGGDGDGREGRGIGSKN